MRGSGVAPDTGKSASFRSCVRCEAVRGREERFRWLAFSKFKRPPVSPRVRPNVFSVLEAEMVAGAGVLKDMRDSVCYVWGF